MFLADGGRRLARRRSADRRLPQAMIRARRPRPVVRRRPVPGGVVHGGLLVMVLLSVVSRQALPRRRHRRLRRLYLMAGASFLALAHTPEARRAHPRHAAALERLAAAARSSGAGGGDAAGGAVGVLRLRSAHQSWTFNDVSTGNDATPLWDPAAGDGRRHVDPWRSPSSTSSCSRFAPEAPRCRATRCCTTNDRRRLTTLTARSPALFADPRQRHVDRPGSPGVAWIGACSCSVAAGRRRDGRDDLGLVVELDAHGAAALRLDG